MWFGRKPSPRNDDPEHEARPGLLTKGFRWFVAIFTGLLLGTLIVWVLTGTPEETPPMIVGSAVPERRMPEDQSGLVPNQDQPIYERVAPGAVAGRGEELLTGPERPLTQNEIAAQATAQDIGRNPPQPADTSPAAPPAEAATVAPVQAEDTPAVTPPAAPPETVAAAPAATPPPPSDNYRIQIASVRTEEEAAAEWKRVAGKHPGLLSRLKPIYERFESQNNGVYYRVQAGPLVDEALAGLLCAQLTARNVGCLVIEP